MNSLTNYLTRAKDYLFGEVSPSKEVPGLRKAFLATDDLPEEILPVDFAHTMRNIFELENLEARIL